MPAPSPQRKSDAIHRALLSGLLSHVGARTDGGEYSGVRGRKFFLFPGSALFRRRPPWVMAAEMLETTKLYGRTAAAVHPLWVERVAAHMVKRDYSDPHWRPDVGRVLAYEKVTLHGLVLVPRRKIHYGPIEPRLAREIFIHHALVLGEYHTDAPYFLANRKLIDEVQELEAKARRRDVLVDPKARFAFFDARVPQRVYTAQEFERWRRIAEKHNPRLLFMNRRDLMLHPALGVTAELYPDEISVGGLSIPLEYRFEAGTRFDGLTARIPLAAVNELAAEPFEWLVPGFRIEKFTALIRTLPKSLRVKFVPIPDRAAGAARELKPSDGPLLDALARSLGKATGETVNAADFQPHLLPAHLHMNFRVIDSAGKDVAGGRNLEAIRAELGLRARASFAASPPPQWRRDRITRWDFDDLPERIEVPVGETTINGYPTLVDMGTSVSLRVFDRPGAAREAMRAGLRRLFMLQLDEEFHQLDRSIPDVDRLSLFYATVGSREDLQNDLRLAIADRAFFDDAPAVDVRTRDEFAARAASGWRRLPSAAAEIADLTRQIFELYHPLSLSLAREFPSLWRDAVRDMSDQLAHLVYPGFLVRGPFDYLRNLPRYLRGIQIRLEKLGNAGLNRDQRAAAEIGPLWEQFKLAAVRQRENGAYGEAMEQYRWLLEELRLALFAPELRKDAPVSTRRLEKLWEQMKKPAAPLA